MIAATVTPFANLVSIMRVFDDNLRVIEVHSAEIESLKPIAHPCSLVVCHKTGKNIFGTIIHFLSTQLRVTWGIIVLSRDVDCWYFFIGDIWILPMIVSKLLGRQVTLILGGYMEREIKHKGNVIERLLVPLKKIDLAYSNRIVVYSRNLIEDWNLESFADRISVANEHFVDFGMFQTKRKLESRARIVGHIGRLSMEKGTRGFVEAIPLILKHDDSVQVLIGGDGRLLKWTEDFVREKSICDRVMIAGWIPHDRLPDYLNDLRLLVIPSHTEGLPNIMLEAMACGTPVLVTHVGAIKALVKDGITGFVLSDSSPEAIAAKVIEVIDSPSLGIVAEAAKEFVQREFSFEETLERWRDIRSGS